MVKKAKELTVTERKIYAPELKTCPTCGGELRPQSYYQWRKTVQHLDRVVYVANQARTCENDACDQAGKRVQSAAAQAVTVPGCTYGLDIIAQIGWWRDREHLTRQEAHQRVLEKGVQISEREVDNLYSHYQVLLACTLSGKQEALAQAVAQRGGLIIGLDGLAPEGASEQLWIVREVQTDTILVAAWLERVDHETLQMLLKPVQNLDMPILCTLSDKQSSVKKALESLWPEIPHQWCQYHYLGNLARPAYDYDSALKTEMRKTIREEIRDSVNRVLDDSEDGQIEFVAGFALNPNSPPSPTKPDSEYSALESSQETDSEQPLPEPDPEAKRQAVRQALALDLKESLRRQGRAPFALSGLPTFADLQAIRQTLAKCLELGEDALLRTWFDALERILPRYQAPFADVNEAITWVETISSILEKPSHTGLLAGSPPPLTSQIVADRLDIYLEQLQNLTDLSAWLLSFRTTLLRTTSRYASGLFHCYDIPDLPPTNNALESLFGQTRRQLRRRLGIGQLRNALRRHAVWALLETGAHSPAVLAQAFAQIPPADFAAQRLRHQARIAKLRHRYLWRRHRDDLLQRRLNAWADAVSAP